MMGMAGGQFNSHSEAMMRTLFCKYCLDGCIVSMNDTSDLSVDRIDN